MRLNNFFYDCRCGHTVKFHDTEDVLTCPVCKRCLVLSTAHKARLVEQREQIKAKLYAQQLA